MDQMQATRRKYPVVGGLADILAAGTSPQRTQQMRGLMEFLQVPDIAQTLDRVSYGEPLTTGAGMTTKLRPEAEASLMTALGMAPVGRATTGGVKAGIKSASKKFIYPQEEALVLAQQRAALPVSKGGLGLPKDNTPEMRANAMFPDVEMYHATDKDFSSIRPSSKGKLGPGVYMSPQPRYAEKYVDENASVLPLRTSGKFAVGDVRDEVGDAARERLFKENPNFGVAEWKKEINKELMNRGYSGVDMEGMERVVFNPENVRSRFAAFDPWRRTAATAALYGVAAPDLLAAEQEPAPDQNESMIQSLLQTLGR